MTSSSEGEILQPNHMIRDRWRIRAKVGGGGFGEIYEAVDLNALMELVAVKVESSKASKQVLKMEVAVLRRLQGKKHACKFYGCGRNEKFNYLVMSLQGRNLADMRRESPRQCFSISTSVRLALQILKSIEDIHQIGFLHRDIKPSNFALGRASATNRNVYMLDFGLSRQYVNAKGDIRSPRSAAGFRGTVRYASLSAHKNKEMGRHDDLWSLFYMIYEFMQGALPWRKIKDKDEVGKMKEEINPEKFLEPLPDEMRDFYMHLEKLGYHDEPNYERLSKCLRDILSRLAVKMDDPFDWEINYENFTSKSKSTAHMSGSKRTETFAVRDRGTTAFEQTGMATQAPLTNDHNEGVGLEVKESRPTKKISTPLALNNYENKPKYKRPDFMKPKPGTVNLHVVDAMQAHLAAASGDADDAVNGGDSPSPAFNRFRCRSVESKRDLFKNLRIETSLENVNDAAANMGVTDLANNTAAASTQSAGGAPSASTVDRLAAPGRPDGQAGKLLKTTSFSKKKRGTASRCSFLLPTEGTVTQFAVCEDDGPSTHQKHGGGGGAGGGCLTLASKWQGSFDESLCDDVNEHVDQLPNESSQPSLRRNGSATNAQSPRLKALSNEGQTSPGLNTNAASTKATPISSKSPVKSALKHTNSVGPYLTTGFKATPSSPAHQAVSAVRNGAAKLPSSSSANNVQRMAVNQASVNAKFSAVSTTPRKSITANKLIEAETQDAGSLAAGKSVPLIVIGGDDHKQQPITEVLTSDVKRTTSNVKKSVDQSDSNGKLGPAPSSTVAGRRESSVECTPRGLSVTADLTGNKKRASTGDLNNGTAISSTSGAQVGGGGGFFSSHFRSIRASFQDLLPNSSTAKHHSHNQHANANANNTSNAKDTENTNKNNLSSSSGVVSTTMFRTALKKSPTEKSTDSGVSSADKSANNLHIDNGRFVTSRKLGPRRNASFKEPAVVVPCTVFADSCIQQARPQVEKVGQQQEEGSRQSAQDVEKELRRQRRFRRRSDCDSFRELVQKMNQTDLNAVLLNNNNDKNSVNNYANYNANGGYCKPMSNGTNVNNLASNVARSVAVAIATNAYPYNGNNANESSATPSTNHNSRGYTNSASHANHANASSNQNGQSSNSTPIGRPPSSYLLCKNLSIHQPPTMAPSATAAPSSLSSPLKQHRSGGGNSYFHDALAVFNKGVNSTGGGASLKLDGRKLSTPSPASLPTSPTATQGAPSSTSNGQAPSTPTIKVPLLSSRRKRYHILS